MDLRIVAETSVALLNTISNTTISITAFVRIVRDARRDMDSVSRELSSLSMSVAALRDDSMDSSISLPPNLERTL